MSYNVISYFLGEGFRNVFKNKKSTISCLGVMCATMLMFGLFYAIGENITYMVESIEDAQAIRVFVVNDATTEDVATIEQELKQIDGINTITYKSKEDAYNEMKEKLEDRQDVMEGIEPSIFSESYIVTLTDLELNSSIQEQIKSLDNIKKITSSNDTINALANIGKWIRIVTGTMLAILVLISIFIISNTIKLTVHARRKEISIMKYVGATNGFVRTPFIVEGVIIGILSSIISLLVVGGGYSLITDKIMKTPTIQEIGIKILDFSSLFTQIIIVYIILGVGIGIIGSSISMKKYLEV